MSERAQDHQQAGPAPAPVAPASAAPVETEAPALTFAAEGMGGLGASYARLDPGQRAAGVLALQRSYGNAWVSRALARTPTAEAPPAGTNTLPNPLDQLPPGLRAHVSAEDAYKMSRYLASFVSSGEDYDRANPILDDHPGPRTVAIPAAPMLRGDILGIGGEGEGEKFVAQNQRDRAFRSGLYGRLLASGFVVHLGARLRGGKPVLEVKVSWGPHNWETDVGPDGKVGWPELMRNQTLNLDYQSAIGAEMVAGIGAMQELREQARSPLDVQGKLLGEIDRKGLPWEPDVVIGKEIGGDEGGLGFSDQVKAMMHMYGSSKGRALLRSAIGDYHVFELSQPLDVLTDFGQSEDGFARITDAESELGDHAQAVLIVGRGGVEFRPAPGGWVAPASKDAVTTGEAMLYGAIIGDFWDDPTAEAVVAQIVVGLIPGVGQAADVRDIAAGIDKLWETSGKEGKLQTLLAVIGLVPGVGDAIKLAYKGGKRAVVAALKEVAPMARRTLAALIKESPHAVASRFKLAQKAAEAAGEIDGLVAKALKTGAEPGEVKAAINAIEQALDAAGGNAGAVVQRAIKSGKWKELAQLIAKGGKDAEGLAKKLNAWRAEEIDALRKYIPNLQSEAARDAGRAVSPPDFKQTGTVKDMTNDVDISFLGPDAGRYSQLAKGYLESRYGMPYEKVKDMLDAEIFTDPTRFLLAQTLGSPGLKKGVDKALTSEAELNTLVKMLRQGVAPERVAEMAKKLGVPEDALKLRKVELEQFADKTFKAQKELEIDALHRQFDMATDEATKAAKAQEIAILQGKLDAVNKEAYTTPGGVATNVVIRDNVAGARGWMSLSPELRYQSVLDDMVTLETTLAKIAKEGINKDTAKPLSKYADRLLTRAGQVGGVEMAAKGKFRETYDHLQGLLAASRRDAAGAATDETLAEPYYDAVMLLRGQVQEIVRASKEAAASKGAAAASKEGVAVGEELVVLEKQLDTLGKLADTVRLRGAAAVGGRQAAKSAGSEDEEQRP